MNSERKKMRVVVVTFDSFQDFYKMELFSLEACDPTSKTKPNKKKKIELKKEIKKVKSTFLNFFLFFQFSFLINLNV